MRTIQADFPWLVSEIDGALAGFSYVGPHRGRPGYKWTVETAIYVAEDFRKRGVARGLYQSLMALLQLQGFQTAYASITVPNEASEALHKSFGSERLGVFKNAGYKHEAWRNALSICRICEKRFQVAYWPLKVQIALPLTSINTTR